MNLLKHKWAVRSVSDADATAFAAALQEVLNQLEQDGYEILTVEPVSAVILHEYGVGGVACKVETFRTIVRARKPFEEVSGTTVFHGEFGTTTLEKQEPFP